MIEGLNPENSLSFNREKWWRGVGWTHWGRVTHICVSKLNIFGWNNGLSPGQHQAIIQTSALLLLIGPLETHFSEISIELPRFSLKIMQLNMSPAEHLLFCFRFNVLMEAPFVNFSFGDIRDFEMCLLCHIPCYIAFMFDRSYNMWYKRNSHNVNRCLIVLKLEKITARRNRFSNFICD